MRSGEVLTNVLPKYSSATAGRGKYRKFFRIEMIAVVAPAGLMHKSTI